MLRAVLSRNVAAETAEIVNSLNLQVRWRRKPRWLGTAKSKIFRVPERTQQDEEERAWLYKETAHYKTAYKAVRAFLIREVEKEKAKTTVLHKSPEQIQAEWDEAFQKNETWNVECAKVRAVRVEKQAKEKRDYVLQKLEEKEERKEEMREKIRQSVLAQKSQVGTFITADNIQEAIEHAFANPKSHNFAIDLDGNIHRDQIIEKKSS